MKKTLICIFLTCLLWNAKAQNKKAVFIIVDGVSRDIIEKLNTPHLKSIAKQGGMFHCYQGGERGEFNETPTISAPGYNNILTGVWFHKHNVPDNAIKAPNYHYPTIFKFFKDAFPSKKTAIFSSWTDNRIKLIGENLPQTNHLLMDYHFDGLELDTIRFPHDKARNFMSKIDQTVAAEAANYIANKAPDLSWVYLEHTDDMGHLHGDSKAYNDAIALADKEIGQIWDAVQQREKNNHEEWLIIVTTDHGRDAETGQNHGGQSDRERATWFVSNVKNINQYGKNQHASAVDIAPTIAKFLDIPLNADQKRELDGVPLIGKISLSNPICVKNEDKLTLSWTPVNNEGNVNIMVASTNEFQSTGKPDSYTKIAEVPVKNGKFILDLSKIPSSEIYKIALEGKYNTVNRWILSK